MVAFSSYEVVERAPYLGETRAWIGAATWRPLDRASVEVLVGGRCREVAVERYGYYGPKK